jgi:hypothetical protein
MVDTVGQAVELIFTLKTKKRILCRCTIPTNPQYLTQEVSNAGCSISVGLETWDLWLPSWIRELE